MPGRKDSSHRPQAVLWELVLPYNINGIIRGVEGVTRRNKKKNYKKEKEKFRL